MKKQQLTVWDTWAQNSNAQKQRENQQAQAQTAVDRAKRDLDRAKTALENFYNGVSNEKEEEDALLLACQEAKGDYDSAVAALESLERGIDQAVQDAISQAEAELQEAALQAATEPEEKQPNEETAPSDETNPTEETTALVDPVTVVEQIPMATEITQEQKNKSKPLFAPVMLKDCLLLRLRYNRHSKQFPMQMQNW